MKLEEISQNQLGMEPEMLAFEKSRYVTCSCDLSQVGNEGPKWHEPISRCWIWNGGAQLELTFKVNELEDKCKNFSLVSFEKSDSLTIPVK